MPRNVLFWGVFFGPFVCLPSLVLRKRRYVFGAVVLVLCEPAFHLLKDWNEERSKIPVGYLLRKVQTSQRTYEANGAIFKMGKQKDRDKTEGYDRHTTKAVTDNSPHFDKIGKQ